ncbi:MAG: ABC transporter permease [Solitalea-like symbiont of Acarus siro]
MKIYLELLIRELKLFSRNTTVIMIFFLAPIIYGVLFGFVYKKGKVTDLPILVIDKDNSPLSNRLLDMLNDNETLIVKKVLAETSNLKQEIIDNGFDAIVIIPERVQASILQRKKKNKTERRKTGTLPATDRLPPARTHPRPHPARPTPPPTVREDQKLSTRTVM